MIRKRVLFFGLIVMGIALLLTILRNERRQSPNEIATINDSEPDIPGQTAPRPRRQVSPEWSSIQQAVQVRAISVTETTNSAKALENEVIVILKPGVTNIDELAGQLGAQVAGRIEKLNAYRLQFDDVRRAAAARDQLQNAQDVQDLDSNYAITRPPAGDELGPSAASSSKLNIKPGNSDGKIVIGLVDSAVQVSSTGLDERLFLPSISAAGEAASLNSLSHGTSMAEAIMQGLGTIEPAQDGTTVRILPVDVYGNSESTTSYQVAEGIVKAIEAGATIINLSLGGEGDSSLIQSIIQDAHAQGIIFLGAAGNTPVTTPTFPAAYPEVIAVTSIDSEGNVASFANYGEFVDVGTPSSVIVNFKSTSYLVSGTSASTALASGVAAGFAEKNKISAAQAEYPIREGLALQ
jgi:hypothetical protein